MPTPPRLAIIGGGPAGLRAAEVTSSAGLAVTIYDGKRSVGRKLLVAGKGGLNLTHGEDFEPFLSRYSGGPNMPADTWRGIIHDFDARALRKWAAELDVGTFQASSGRVYPNALKAAPLLRRWVARLKQSGVQFAMNHHWTGLTPSTNGTPYQLTFTNGETAEYDAVILALGGGSWPQTGSDGTWQQTLASLGIACSPLTPANCGWECPWPNDLLNAAEGQPIKNITVRAGSQEVVGELMLTRYGFEGGAIYQLGRALRSMNQPAIEIDFKPTFSHDQLVRKMESVKRDFLDHAKTRWRLSPAAHAILARNPWTDAASLAAEVKHCTIPLTRPRPLAEAISSAGGVCWSELDDSLMLTRLPGVFVAGEMIDWDAPTGGYLMQACFATGTHAASAAARFLKGSAITSA